MLEKVTLLMEPRLLLPTSIALQGLGITASLKSWKTRPAPLKPAGLVFSTRMSRKV